MARGWRGRSSAIPLMVDLLTSNSGAVSESPAALLEAVTDPEFSKIAGGYPDGTVGTRQLVRTASVAGICVA